MAAVAGVGLVLAVSAVGFTFVKRPLAVPAAAVEALPAAPSVAGVSVEVLPTARIETQHGLSVRGAPLQGPLTSAMVAILVTHPRGTLLVDAGMGVNGVAHLDTTPALMQALVTLDLQQGIAAALAGRGLAADDLHAVVLTHAHWDHVSGLQDLPDVPVWLTAEELAYAQHDEGGLLYRQIDAASPLDTHLVQLDGPAYGPFPRSLDVFGDGAVVLVPMPGHTPGSIGVFVNVSATERYLFIGDTAWAEEGVTWPAEKPWLSRRLVDLDAAQVRDQLVRLHRLDRQHPELTVVPAHDARVHARIDER